MMQINNEEKKKVFEGFLVEQAKQRQLLHEKKKILETLKNNPQEDMLFIQKQFRNLFQEMDTLVLQYKEKTIPFEILQSFFTKIKNYYVDISYVLTTYDRQFYKESLEKVQNHILELKKKHQVKKKFKFSRRNQDFGVQETQSEPEIVKAKESKQQINIAGIQNQTDQKILIREGWTSIGSYKIVHCENVEVELLQKTEILFLKNLKNCKIKAALVKSTVFVDHCVNCIFELNCHQLRIHNTTATTFGIFVTSKAIIEDCNSVIFKPYSFNYENKEKDEILFERVGKENLWKDIQDFNWLKQNQKSPHFELIQQ